MRKLSVVLGVSLLVLPAAASTFVPECAAGFDTNEELDCAVSISPEEAEPFRHADRGKALSLNKRTEVELPAVDLRDAILTRVPLPETTTPASHSTISKAVNSITDITGERIFSYSTLLNGEEGHYNGGCLVTIEQIAGTDSILISDFFSTGVEVKAKVNIDSMSISIPNQVLTGLGTHSKYGVYDLCYAYWEDDWPLADRTQEIIGTITDDGLITFDTYWGIFYPNSSSYLCAAAYSGATTSLVNGQMIYTYYDITTTSEVVDTVKINVSQEDDIVYVRNFCDYGVTLQAQLYGSKRAYIKSVTMGFSSIGEMNTAAVTFSDDYTSVTVNSYYIVSNVATESNVISWNNWSIVDESYSYLLGLDCKIVAPFDIVYPDASGLLASGDGTAESPYLITSAKEWNNLVTYSSEMLESFEGKYIKLGNDIDFTEETVTTLAYDGVVYFNGDLDGDGHTVKGISGTASVTYSGSMIRYAEYANIHDFTVEGEYNITKMWDGGVVGYLYNGTITNVNSKMTVTASGQYCGGILGYAAGTTAVTGCNHYGDFTGSANWVASVVGYASYKTTVTDCNNYGTVTATKDYVGGVLGEGWGYSDSDDMVNVYNCNNYGTVTTESSDHVGGVVADITVSSSFGTSITTPTNPGMTNCCNYGTVSATSGTSSRIGGIAGRYCYAKIYDCHNRGVVTSAGYASGIVSYALSATILDCTNDSVVTTSYNTAAGICALFRASSASGCANYGTVENTSTSQYGAGGVIGYAYMYSGLSDFSVGDCYNLGIVTSAADCTGGVVGYTQSDANGTITGCYNAGTVTSTAQYVGGVLGCGYGGNSLSDCYNLSNVTSTSTYVGGIAGYTNDTVYSSYNTATISASDYVGGIAGYTNGAISTAYTSGFISTTGSNYGNIYGTKASGTTAGIVSGCYYLTANDCEGTIVAGTGLTYSELGALELDGWINGDAYTYPYLQDNDYAKAYAAAVIPADGDSYSSITSGFNVGAPDGVTWTASTDAISFDGNTATFTETVDGTVTLTATCGDVSVTTEITCNVEVEGINDVVGNALEVVSEKFYTTGGSRVAEPSEDARAIYIVVKTYNDGTTEAVKEVR